MDLRAVVYPYIFFFLEMVPPLLWLVVLWVGAALLHGIPIVSGSSNMLRRRCRWPVYRVLYPRNTCPQHDTALGVWYKEQTRAMLLQKSGHKNNTVAPWRKAWKLQRV